MEPSTQTRATACDVTQAHSTASTATTMSPPRREGATAPPPTVGGPYRRALMPHFARVDDCVFPPPRTHLQDRPSESGNGLRLMCPPSNAALGRPVAVGFRDGKRSTRHARTCTVELRALGSTGSPPRGARPRCRAGRACDFGSSVIPGRRTSRPKDLFVVDGGSPCPEGTLPCHVVCCVVLGGRVFSCPSRWPRHSICSLEASVAIAGEWNTARRKRHSRRSATCGNGRGDRI